MQTFLVLTIIAIYGLPYPTDSLPYINAYLTGSRILAPRRQRLIMIAEPYGLQKRTSPLYSESITVKESNLNR